MAGCEKQEFRGVTGGHYAEVLKEGAELGLPIHGETGQATQDGVTVRWAYDAASSLLTIECLDAPRFVPCSMINSRIQSVMQGILEKSGWVSV